MCVKWKGSVDSVLGPSGVLCVCKNGRAPWTQFLGLQLCCVSKRQ